MSKYFEKLEFAQEFPKPKPVEQFPEAEKFRKAIDLYREEVDRIQKGTSKNVPRAIQFPKGICLPSVVLDRFYSAPSEQYLRDFLEVCKQDFGLKAATAIAEWFGEIYPKAKEMVK